MSTNKRFTSNEPKISQEDNKAIEKTKKNFLWVQEFSKKVIVILLLLYITYFIGALIALYKLILDGNAVGFETLTTEINETFRFIVGGYLIKSGLENITKIGGDYYGTIAKIKTLSVKKDNDLVQDEDIDQVLSESTESNYSEVENYIDQS